MSNETAINASISLAVVGSGGAGAVTAGSMVLKAAAKLGWYGMFTRSVGPQIRGGEAAALVRLSEMPVSGHGNRYDLLLALDWQNVDRFAAEIPLDAESLVVADSEVGDVPEVILGSGAQIVQLPITEIAENIEGGRPNMVALGIVAGLVGINGDNVNGVIEGALRKKGAAAIDASQEAAAAGATAVGELSFSTALKPLAENDGRWLITGNEAAGLGATRGGVRFVAAYPITPATDLLEWMAPALAKVGGRLVQAEDELASINMAIGASYGGIPSLTATSGPGLALMSESIGLAAASEVPVVIVDVMRGGPSTGLPTKAEQSDLNLAIYGLHGDAPHLVTAPSSVADCLFTTQWSVHLAEALQVPAIVLSDQFMGQAQAVIDRPADLGFVSRREIAVEPGEDYQRYAVTASGVSPMAIPGTPNGQYTAEGLTHTECGAVSNRSEDHGAQLDKRQAKLENFDFGDHWAEIEGEGSVAVIAMGSAVAPLREAVAELREGGTPIRLIALRLLAPALPEAMGRALDGVEKVIVVEQTHQGQLYRYLRAHYDLPAEVKSFHRPGPLPFRPDELQGAIDTWVSS